MAFQFDISAEIAAIQNARYGRDVRQTIVNALTKMNNLAASIDPDKLQGGTTTTVIANGTMFRLEDYSAYNPDATPVEMTAILRGAVAEAKTLGFPGLLFPKDTHFLVDFAPGDDKQIIINVPDNFGIDFNGSTIEVERIPTVVNSDGSFDKDSTDKRPYVIVAMCCDNSYIRNGTLNGGADKVFPESFVKHDSENSWSGDGVSIDGENNLVESMNIVGAIGDGIRIDSGSIAKEARADNDISGNRFDIHKEYMQFMFKDEGYYSANGKDYLYIDNVEDEYPSDFKLENGKLISKWIRLSGGRKVPQAYAVHVSGPSRGVYPNSRGTDFIENDVQELSVFYRTLANINDSKYRMGMFYEVEFASDTFFDTAAEGTFNEIDNGATLKTIGKMGYEIDFTRLGSDTSNSENVWNSFVGGNPLKGEFVKVSDDVIEASIFNDTSTTVDSVFQSGGGLLRNKKRYYELDENGTFVECTDLPNFSNPSGYYVKKSKWPLIRIKIPVENLSDLEDLRDGIETLAPEYRPGDGTLKKTDILSTSYNYFGIPSGTSTYIQGIIRPNRYNTIRNIIIRNAGRNGITLGNTHHTTIENFVITGSYYVNPKAAIDLEEGGMGCHDNIIRNGIMRDCHYALCFTTCQENKLDNLISTGCKFGVYASDAQSFSITNSLFIMRPDNDRVVEILGDIPIYKDFPSRSLRDCQVFGGAEVAHTLLDNCRLEVHYMRMDKTSRATNCDILSLKRNLIEICGSYHRCNFTDFNTLVISGDATRDYKPGNMLNIFKDCVIEGDILRFEPYYFDVSGKTADNRTYPDDYALCPIESLTDCIITCPKIVGISAERIESTRFVGINHSLAVPVIRARMVANCSFECAESDSLSAIVSVPGKTNLWDMIAMTFSNNTFIGPNTNSISGDAFAVVVTEETADTAIDSIRFVGNHCLSKSSNGPIPLKSIKNNYQSGGPELIVENNYGFNDTEA